MRDKMVPRNNSYSDDTMPRGSIYLNSFRVRLSHGISRLLLQNYPELKGVLFIQSKLRETLCRWLTPSIQGFVVCPTLYNIDLLVNAEDWIGEYVCIFGEYEAGTISVLQNYLHKGDIFLDVGANIGAISCVASRLVGDEGSVYAAEPNPKNYKMLNANIRLNKLKNVYPFQTALGSIEAVAQLYNKNEKDSGMASLIRDEKAIGRGIEVTVTSIDKLLEENQMRIPDFIKIDVEGYELEVLKGATGLLQSLNAPTLCIEYVKQMSRKRGNAEDIYDFVKSINNYSVYKLKRTSFMPSKLILIQKEGLPDHDNIFCFPHTYKV
jgi:FkbM family methyltransferase